MLQRTYHLRLHAPDKHIYLRTDDVPDTFRQLPLDADYARHFACIIGCCVAVQLTLPFGWCGSPAHFGVWADVISDRMASCTPATPTSAAAKRIVAENYGCVVQHPDDVAPTHFTPDGAALGSFDAADEHYAVPHHVDDFCSSDNRSERVLRTHCELFEDAMRAAFDCTSQLTKAKAWATTCTMLGVTINTVAGTISLSEERMARILELLNILFPAHKLTATVHELQSLMGTLRSACAVTPIGRYWLSQIQTLISSATAAATPTAAASGASSGAASAAPAQQ